MKLPRPKLAHAILWTGLLLLAGCVDRRDRLDETRFNEAVVSPLAKEYILAANRSFYYRSLATSLRSESDQPREGKIMHSETAVQCPDRYHLRITGAIDLERIVVGRTQYERRNNGVWTTMPQEGVAPYLGRCSYIEKNKRSPVPDAAQVELVAPYWGAITVVKGPQREYHGIPCQEYTLSGADRPAGTACYSLGPETYLIHSDHNQVVTTEYDFNKPIVIEPPVPDAAASKAR